MLFLIRFLVVSTLTICLDILWIGFVAKDFLISLIKPYLTIDQMGQLVIRNHYAIGCWLLLSFGVYFFVTKNSCPSDSLFTIFQTGCIFGFVVYGVYDLTNAALQLQWPVSMIIADTMWGSFLCGVCAVLWHFIK
jgi:uncharacterized membrane protein